jgi:small subunit ribosomal protein S20
MPHLKSAKKRVKQDALRRARNRATLKELKTQVKKLLAACKAGDAAQAQTELKATFSKIDKCGTRGYIHKNAIGRHKQRLSARVAKLAAPAAAGS